MMSMLQRLLLLLSVAALLREGNSNSPLDFFKDLKTRMFGSGNSTESAEEPSIQCSGSDQDGICTLQNITTNGSLDVSKEKLYDSELKAGTKSKESEMLTSNQLIVNETIADDTNNLNNTQYYEDGEWNTTTTNSTNNEGNDFKYPENELNGTSGNSDIPATEDKKTIIRSKRQISEVKINIKLKTPKITTKPVIEEKITILRKSDNSSLKKSLNATETEHKIQQDEQCTTDLSRAIDVNKTGSKTDFAGDEIKKNLIVDELITNESARTTLQNSEEIICSNGTSCISKQNSVLEESNPNVTAFLNCTTCVASEQNTDILNISSSLSKDLNVTEALDVEEENSNENITEINNNYTTGQINVAVLKEILENSTRVFEKIVQNIVPVISEDSNKTNTNASDNTKIENNRIKNMTDDPNTVLENVMFNNTDENTDTTSLADTSIAENLKIEVDTTNGTSNINSTNNTNSTEVIPIANNANNSMTLENNIPVIERDKRNINFTILSDSDEESDLSTFPYIKENVTTNLSSSIITNSIELSSTYPTEEVEIVGPVCFKRYEQCTNSTDCCEDYECVDAGENNSTLYCDLRPENFTSAALPLTEDKN